MSGGIPLVGVLDLVRVDALISSRCGTKVHTSPSAREVLTNRQQVVALDGTAVSWSMSPVARPAARRRMPPITGCADDPRSGPYPGISSTRSHRSAGGPECPVKDRHLRRCETSGRQYVSAELGGSTGRALAEIRSPHRHSSHPSGVAFRTLWDARPLAECLRIARRGRPTG